MNNYNPSSPPKLFTKLLNRNVFTSCIFLLCYALQAFANPSLFDGIKKHKLQEVEALLADGIDPNQTNGILGKTALLTAIEEQDTSMVQLLLNHGANPNLSNPIYDRNSLHYPLYKAISLNQPDIVKLLLHAQPNPADPNGAKLVTARPLSVLINRGRDYDDKATEIAKDLVAAGADVNPALAQDAKESDTLLGMLVRKSRSGEPFFLEVARTLVEHGARINQMGLNKISPLDHAQFLSHSALYQYLHNMGAIRTPQMERQAIIDAHAHTTGSSPADQKSTEEEVVDTSEGGNPWRSSEYSPEELERIVRESNSEHFKEILQAYAQRNGIEVSEFKSIINITRQIHEFIPQTYRADKIFGPIRCLACQSTLESFEMSGHAQRSLLPFSCHPDIPQTLNDQRISDLAYQLSRISLNQQDSSCPVCRQAIMTEMTGEHFLRALKVLEKTVSIYRDSRSDGSSPGRRVSKQQK